MVADGRVCKLWNSSSQFLCLASEEPAVRALEVEVKDAMKQAELHHETCMVKLETRADTVAAHGIIVCHGNQASFIVFKHLAVKLRVVVVWQDKIFLVRAQLDGVC